MGTDGNDPSPPEPPKKKELVIRLLEPVDTLADWPRDNEGEPRRTVFFTDPHVVVAQLPSGERLQIVSQATFVTQLGGVIAIVNVMPRKGVLEFPQAISLLEETLVAWDSKPTAIAQKRLAKWKKLGKIEPTAFGGGFLGGATIRGEDKLDIFFQIRSTDSGWYVVIEIGADQAESRRLMGITVDPENDSKPKKPAEPSKDEDQNDEKPEKDESTPKKPAEPSKE